MPGYFPYDGIWYKFDKREKKFSTGRYFKYRTYDDQQHRTFVSQRQAGTRTSKSSLSIETPTGYSFGDEDKIYLVNKEKTYKIEEVEDSDDIQTNLLNVIAPMADTKLKRLHLNKAR